MHSFQMRAAAVSTEVIATLKMQVNSSDQQCCISRLLFLWKVSYLAGQSLHVFSSVTTPIIHYLYWLKWPTLLHCVHDLCHSSRLDMFHLYYFVCFHLMIAALQPSPGDSALIHNAFIRLHKIVSFFFYGGTLAPWVRLACVLMLTSGQIPLNYLNQHSWASVCQCSYLAAVVVQKVTCLVMYMLASPPAHLQGWITDCEDKKIPFTHTHFCFIKEGSCCK